MVDRKVAFRQQFLKVAIADLIATIPAHRPQDHITLEMAPLEIRHRSVRPISAKHAQAWRRLDRSEEHTSELQSLMRSSYAVFCLKRNTYLQSVLPIYRATRPRHLESSVQHITAANRD